MNKDKLTATKVSQYLDVSVVTLTNWYKWYNDPQYEKPEDVPPLPPYQQLKKGAVRYWDKSDLAQLKTFQNWIPRGRGGVMGALNAQYWGERGKKEAKEEDDKPKGVPINRTLRFR